MSLPLDLGITFTGAWGLYPLSAAATNLFRLRRVSDSAEQDIARSGNVPDTAAVATFLTATTGRVKTLYDQSGANNATQSTAGSQPKYKTHLGYATADFKGLSTGLVTAGPTLTGRNFTVYAVFCVQDVTYGNMTWWPTSIPCWNISGGGAYDSGESRTVTETLVLQWGAYPVSTAMIGGNGNLNIAMWRSNGTNTRFRVNDVVADTGTLTDTSATAFTGLGYQVAASAISEGARLVAMLVGPAHTSTEEGLVIASIRTLLGDAAKTKMVLFDGDSITAGNNEDTGVDERDLSWPYQCMQALADTSVLAGNRAVSSSQIVDGTASPNKDLTSWGLKKLDVQFTAPGSSYTQKVLVVMAGRNDIAVINAAGAGLTTYNRLVTYCAARKAAVSGLKIIVVNAIPAKDTDVTLTNVIGERADYNARIAANGLTNWDAVVDAAALAWKPGGGSDWTTNYQGTDGLHPNAAGRTLLANAVGPYLQAQGIGVAAVIPAAKNRSVSQAVSRAATF